MELKLFAEVTQNGTLTVTDITNTIVDINVEWSRKNSPGKMTINGYNNDGLVIPKGSKMSLYVDGTPFFKGILFTNQFDKYNKTAYTCYDQLRYLKASDSYMFQNMTATQIIKKLAGIFNLTCGDMEDTKYAIPQLLLENKTLIDIVSIALQRTIAGTGIIYTLYDDFGKLRLTQANKMLGKVTLTYGGTLLDYQYKGTIDEETYNRIKLVYDTSPTNATGLSNGVIKDDTTTESKWGVLQYIDTISAQNGAQPEEWAKNLMTYYNRELKTVSFNAIGDKTVRGGSMVYVDLNKMDDTNMKGFMLVDRVTHTFRNNYHTMSVSVRELTQLSNWNNLWKVAT